MIPMTEHARASRDALARSLARVAAGSTIWRPFALLALYEAAVTSSALTSDEVWIILDAHAIPHPREPRAMGPVMLLGVRRGWIEATKEFRVADDPATSRNHGRPQRVYVSKFVGYPSPIWPPRPDITTKHEWPTEPFDVKAAPTIEDAIVRAEDNLTVRRAAPARDTRPCPKCGASVEVSPDPAFPDYLTGFCTSKACRSKERRRMFRAHP